MKNKKGLLKGKITKIDTNNPKEYLLHIIKYEGKNIDDVIITELIKKYNVLSDKFIYVNDNLFSYELHGENNPYQRCVITNIIDNKSFDFVINNETIDYLKNISITRALEQHYINEKYKNLKIIIKHNDEVYFDKKYKSFLINIFEYFNIANKSKTSFIFLDSDYYQFEYYSNHTLKIKLKKQEWLELNLNNFEHELFIKELNVILNIQK